MKNLFSRARIVALVTIGALAFAGAVAQAEVPGRLSFQGKLLDTSNQPRNGTYSLTFSLWDSGPSTAGGSQLWTETQGSVAVSNGVFSTQLGSVTPIPTSVFAGSTVYLQIQIGAETASARQRLVTSPYAYRASVADDVEAGDGDYVQNRTGLQPSSTFHVGSGTVAGQLTVGGVLIAGSGSQQVTTAAGLLDASKLTGTVPSGSLSGTYPSLTAGSVLAGSTNYVHNRDTLQTGTSFYVAKGSVAGPLTATGTVTLGGTAGVSDVTVQSNLIVNGAGPHVFTGDVRVNGNDLLDSAGTSRITLGSQIVMNGEIDAAANQAYVKVSTPVALSGSANGDNYIAFPMTAGGTIAAKNLVIISGANSVTTTNSAANINAVGVAVNAATSGETVWVAMTGIVTSIPTAGAVVVGAGICSSATAGAVDDTCNANLVVIGKALTGSTGAGQTISAVLFQGR